MLSERNQTKKEYTLNNSIYTNSRKCKLTYTQRKQISDCLEIGVSGKGVGGKDLKKATRKPLGMMVSWVFTYIKTHQTVQFNVI